MSETSITVSVLNLNADPHPQDIYVACLREAAKHGVQVRGSDFAKITNPAKIRNEQAYLGRILVWTELDPEGRWLNMDEEDELSDDEKNEIQIPENAKPNYRSFNYVFAEKNHKLYYESQNELGHKLGQKSARKIFSHLFSQPSVLALSNISVSIQPEPTAIEKILSIQRIKKIHMRINNPNGDHTDEDAKKRLLERLKGIKASRKDEIYSTRKIKEDIIPDDELKKDASVAAETGFVRVDAYDDNGQRFSVATNDFPRQISMIAPTGSALFQQLKGIDKELS